MTDKLETIIGDSTQSLDAQNQKLLVMVRGWFPEDRAQQSAAISAALASVLADIALNEGADRAVALWDANLRAVTESLSDEFMGLVGKLGERLRNPE